MEQSALACELLLRRRARESFADFNRAVCPEGEEPARHHLITCNAVDALIEGVQQRIMLFQPPGTAKTTYSTLRAPAYYLGRMQGKRKGIITASHTEGIAGSFGRRVRNLVKSPRYQSIFPGVTLTKDSQAKLEWDTDDGGFYFACGVGQGIAGRRGDLGIIDDPNKNRKDADSKLSQEEKWEWYISDFITRLKPDTAAQLLIGTRWTENDIFGRLLPENWAGESGLINCRDGNDWLVISMAAENQSLTDPLGRPIEGEDRWLWPEFFTPDYWEDIKRTQMLIPRNWWSLYQQVPSAHEGNLFRRKHTRWYATLPKQLNYYMTGDYAVSDEDGADWSVIIVWGVDPRGDIYVVDIWRGQSEIVDDSGAGGWLEEILSRIEKYRPLYHGAETGTIKRVMEPLLKAGMRSRRATSLEWFPHSESDKVGDSQAFLALYNGGRVYWPEGSADADWVLQWLYKFPAGAVDDPVDACSMLGKLLDKVWSPAEQEEDEPVKVIQPDPMTWAGIMEPPRHNDNRGW